MTRSGRYALEKAQDAALLAVEMYNKPGLRFKTDSYISTMIIAWTSLMHAIFYTDHIKPYYRKRGGKYERLAGGDIKQWELATCIKEYYKTDTDNPVRKNLEFFIPLRNKIEHAARKLVCAEIFGECQALVLNFDELIKNKFGERFRLREALSFALQMFPDTEGLGQAAKRTKSDASFLEFITRYRTTISNDAIGSSKYAFKAFLIQVAKHEGPETTAVRFVNYDKLSTEQKEQLNYITAITKTKEVPLRNLGQMRAGQIVQEVRKRLSEKKDGKDFTINTHSRAWVRYNIRPKKNADNPESNIAYTTSCIEIIPTHKHGLNSCL